MDTTSIVAIAGTVGTLAGPIITLWLKERFDREREQKERAQRLIEVNLEERRNALRDLWVATRQLEEKLRRFKNALRMLDDSEESAGDVKEWQELVKQISLYLDVAEQVEVWLDEATAEAVNQISFTAMAAEIRFIPKAPKDPIVRGIIGEAEVGEFIDRSVRQAQQLRAQIRHSLGLVALDLQVSRIIPDQGKPALPRPPGPPASKAASRGNP